MDIAASLLALLVGLSVGALFSYLRIPVPAPLELPGVVAIFGIYLGYRLIEWSGVGFDLLESLGL